MFNGERSRRSAVIPVWMVVHLAVGRLDRMRLLRNQDGQGAHSAMNHGFAPLWNSPSVQRRTAVIHDLSPASCGLADAWWAISPAALVATMALA